MKPGVVQTLLCFVGLNSPENCIGQLNWKNRKHVHLTTTQRINKTIDHARDLSYFGNELRNDQHFAKVLDVILVPRPVGSALHRKVKNFIIKEMKSKKWTVETDDFSQNTVVGQKSFSTVIATLDPDAPRRMVIACHYDTLIDSSKLKNFVGATDSAVPCAMMLNLAHTLRNDLKAKTRKKPELTFQFIFFDGEEAFRRWSSTDSIYGARHLAQKWQNQGYTRGGVSGNELDRIDIFTLLDLIGAANPKFSKLESSTGGWYDRLVKIESRLRQINVLQGPRIFQDKSLRAGIEDDHIPFKRRDVPILHLITYPFPPEWHEMGDNRNSLDMASISNINKILRVFVAEYLHL